jgi:hypothetical protein
MGSPFRAVVLAVFALAVAAAPAGAERPATPAEAAETAALARTTTDCVDVTVSTVDTSWLDYRSTNGEGCPQTDDTYVAHRAAGALTAVTSSPGVGLCPVDGVPDAVARDLQLCVEPSVTVYLARPVSKSVTVSTLRPTQIWARDRAYYKGVRWTHWGSATATGRGRLDYYAGQKFKADVELRVSRIQVCGERRRTYTRLSMRFVHASDRKAHGWLEGAKTLGCPVSEG